MKKIKISKKRIKAAWRNTQPKQKLKPCKHRPHKFTYYSGEAPCTICGWFLQPSGKVTRKP